MRYAHRFWGGFMIAFGPVVLTLAAAEVLQPVPTVFIAAISVVLGIVTMSQNTANGDVNATVTTAVRHEP